MCCERDEGSKGRDPATLANRKPEQDTLSLEVVELDGKPIEEPDFLELVDREVRPRS